MIALRLLYSLADASPDVNLASWCAGWKARPCLVVEGVSLLIQIACAGVIGFPPTVTKFRNKVRGASTSVDSAIKR